MSTSQKVVKSIVWGGGLIGLGVLLLKYTVPSEDDLRKAMSPDLQRQARHMEQSEAARNEKARLLAAIRENAQSDRPVWDVRGLNDLGKKSA
ncbi:hypothetical protein BCR44DRAFT_41152, partial [Catenaria anguillulae PL171]